VSQFNNNELTKIANIPVLPCRGRRERFLPFLNKKPALLKALVRAEKAYDSALKKEAIIDHCLHLKTIFEEQKIFFKKFDQMLRAWKSLPLIAKNDLAEVANYFLAITQHGGNEELVATRPPASAETLIAQFDEVFFAIHRAANAPDNFKDSPSKKKDRINNRSVTPLREFSYVLKLHWDSSMRSVAGPEFDKKFPFSIAHDIVFAAVGVLTEKYTKFDVARIIRSLQTLNYSPESFRTPLPEGLSSLKFLRPQLAIFPSSLNDLGLRRRSKS
jgi:hypothetical protein